MDLCVRSAWLLPSRSCVRGVPSSADGISPCTARIGNVCRPSGAARRANIHYWRDQGSSPERAGGISTMRVTPGGVETFFPRVVLGTSVLAVVWTAYVAMLWESVSLAASALYQLAVVMLYRRNFDVAADGGRDSDESATMRILVVITVLIPIPFLAGGAVHALNHASNLAPRDLLPAAIWACTVGTLRTWYGWRFRRRGGVIFVTRAILAVLPFMAPLLVVGSIAVGLDNVDGVIGIALVLILLSVVLAPQLVYLSRLFD